MELNWGINCSTLPNIGELDFDKYPYGAKLGCLYQDKFNSSRTDWITRLTVCFNDLVGDPVIFTVDEPDISVIELANNYIEAFAGNKIFDEEGYLIPVMYKGQKFKDLINNAEALLFMEIEGGIVRGE